MGTVVQGAAFGTGSAIAHRAVGAVAGSMGGGDRDEHGSYENAPQQQGGGGAGGAAENLARAAGGSCAVDQKQLYQCLEENSGSAAACQYFFDALKLCQDNTKYAQQYGQ